MTNVNIKQATPINRVLLGVAVTLIPLFGLPLETGKSDVSAGIEFGLSAIRSINTEKWRVKSAESIGSCVCGKIASITNITERMKYHEAYRESVMSMPFDKSNSREAESSISRFLDLSSVGFRFFSRSKQECERVAAWNLLLTALIRAKYEVTQLELQVAHEIALEEKHRNEIMAWQRKCLGYGIPCKRGLLTRSGSGKATANGVKAQYETTIATHIDSDSLYWCLGEMPEERRRVLAENIRLAIGRYPKWYDVIPPQGTNVTPEH